MRHPLRRMTATLVVTAASHAHAELQIVDFEVSVFARAPQRGITVEERKSDDTPLGVPWALTALVDATHGPTALEQTVVGSASATQTKTGWFKAHSIATHGWTSEWTETSSGTRFYMLLETTTPDTPMVLHFNFMGSRARAEAHYGARNINLDVDAFIATSRNPSSGFIPGEVDAVWGVRDAVRANGPYTFSSSIVDRQGIGVPTASTVDEWVEFKRIGEIKRGAFSGTLDFGLLQPGEQFAITYSSHTHLLVDSTYATTAVVEVVDPFSLEETLPQFTMDGLALPAAPVPEPSTYTTLAAGLLVLVAGRHRHRTTAVHPTA